MRDISKYSSNFEVYSTKEEILKMQEAKECFREIRNIVDKGYHSKFLTDDQIIQIYEIIKGANNG